MNLSIPPLIHRLILFPKQRPLGTLVAAFALGALWLTLRAHAKAAPISSPALTLPTVGVVPVVREDLGLEVTIPAEFRPYEEVSLHAKVAGYLEQMKVDIGDHVKEGQLLATLEVPELKDELASALAAEQRAGADYTNANLIYTRLTEVNKQHPNLVAPQDLDTAEAKALTASAAWSAAKAEAEKYRTLEDYTHIDAPFNGVITRRFADPGDLIQAGTSSDTQTKPLVRVSDNYRLRLDFPVSVTYVKDVRIGDPIEVHVESLGNKSFNGTIARCTERVEEDTRTMVAEAEVANPNLEIVPGMYARVVLKVERRPGALAVPVEAIAGDRNHSTVFMVNNSHEIEERSIKLGLETPAKYEVLAGLKQGDLVMIGSRSQVKPGEKVEAKLTEGLAR